MPTVRDGGVMDGLPQQVASSPLYNTSIYANAISPTHALNLNPTPNPLHPRRLVTTIISASASNPQPCDKGRKNERKEEREKK